MTTLALTALITLSQLLGSWQYVGFIYQAHRYPMPNPELHLTFTFQDDQFVKLYWDREDQPGFCERIARYSLQNNSLYQEITWVNPENLPECQSDPDMQLGKKSVTPIELVGTELHLLFDVNGSEFRYILAPKI
jgi:hypothetical protein